MAFVITQTCIDTRDQACVEVCPVDCIHFEEGADRMLYINPLECIDCGACQPACPVTAIFPEADVPEAMRFFSEVNTGWYTDPGAARARVAGLSGGGGAATAAAPAAEASGGAAPAAPAMPRPAAAATAAAAPASAPDADRGAYKYGEGGIEGKCSLCGQYVTKGGVKFRLKSVLCPECATRQDRIGDPNHRVAGQR
ncbi:MAG: ferredoxin family protein [Chloroflexi bacterium]|nr:MAG: ferredoxin family protein [Chloroflexota bacterium]